MTTGAALLLLATFRLAAETPCEQLKALQLSHTTITAAEWVDAVGRNPESAIPAHCRVAFAMNPSSDSDIRAEVRLPASGDWNGKFLGVGGGGWVGALNVNGMVRGVRNGYATASTDAGHQGGGGSFALGHPEKVIDFAYRAVREMTIAAKAVIQGHYGRPARLSYWEGCSTGGRQGLMEAIRYPEDYDGIVAGAPANNQIQLCGWRMALEVSALKDPARSIPPPKLAALQQAVLTACDTLDGVKDRFMTEPRNCRFDPSTLLCRGSNEDNCLTAAQVESVRMAYSPARKKNGELIYPGLVPGNEPAWLLLTNARNEPNALDLGMFRFVAHQDPAWDWRTFDVERDTILAQVQAGFIEATDPDLSAFKKRGGKLLIYHGWSDGGSGGAISPLNTIAYYESVLKKMGPQQNDWLGLFMVPGMDHCGAGPGPDQFNSIAALERWREFGMPPNQILAAHVSDDRRVSMTRPLCPYPQVAVYKCTGTANDAANFTCK
jgi:feruloyl esterase